MPHATVLVDLIIQASRSIWQNLRQHQLPACAPAANGSRRYLDALSMAEKLPQGEVEERLIHPYPEDETAIIELAATWLVQLGVHPEGSLQGRI